MATFNRKDIVRLGIKRLERWTDTYNTIRPHQSLAYQTPQEYYQAWLKEHAPKASLM